VGFYYFIERYHELEEIFKRILIANFCFTLIACIIYFTPFREVLWYKNKFTQSVEGFHRLALLTFEASYYSLLFAPIAIYYLAKIFFRINTKPANGTLILVLVPLFLSLSMGVLGAILIAFLAIYIIHWQKVFYKRNFFNYLIIFLVVLFFTATIILIFFPNNVLLIRINNIL
jgi:O-antigen/teichoic acid export membrane protein